MTDPEWERFEEEERKKFYSQQCPFPKYDAWCETKQYQSERNMSQYVQARDKAELAWNQSFPARLAEFERQLLQKKEKYLANKRLLYALREQNTGLNEKLQQYEQKVQELIKKIKEINTIIQSLKL